MIFVFGSNLNGVHGKGAALHAVRKYGAVYGVYNGRQGNAYAIPTKSTPYKTLDLELIKCYVDKFISYATENPDELFFVTQIGCGLAGYTPKDIAPMFINSPKNCIFDIAWRDYLPDYQYHTGDDK